MFIFKLFRSFYVDIVFSSCCNVVFDHDVKRIRMIVVTINLFEFNEMRGYFVQCGECLCICVCVACFKLRGDRIRIRSVECERKLIVSWNGLVVK